MEAGIDPVVYEAITDHSYAVAMKHYQMPHTARLQKGYAKVHAAFGLKNGLTLGSNPGLHCHDESCTLEQQGSQDPYFCDSLQETENACNFLQAFNLEINGLSKDASDTVNYGVCLDLPEGESRLLGRGEMGWAISELFLLLNEDAQQEVLHSLGEMVHR